MKRDWDDDRDDRDWKDDWSPARWMHDWYSPRSMKGWYSPRWVTGWYGEGGALLAQRVVQRTARYYGDVADLTGRGSVEPRIWIGTMQRFWSGLAEDYGDYLKIATGRESAGDLIEVSESEPPILRIDLVEGSKTASATIEGTNRLLDGSAEDFVLQTAGLSNATRRVLYPDRHLRFEPSVLTTAKPSKLLLHDLPDDLTAGMRLSGLITARRKRKKDEDDGATKKLPLVLVAVVQLRVV